MQLTVISLSPDDLRQVIREEVERIVRRPSPALTEPLRYLSISDAVQKHRVSKSFLYRLSSERTISTRRVGKSVEFDAQELEAYFDKTARKSINTIDANLRKEGVFPTLKGKHHV
ncbi:helix-turn-helix domain-containing protein [Hymenobacter sp. BT683]|uniref:Helix-turn-helix domain-containing protein n=1 Tax=Hymenobacter jeongseonensis TaxID=2791027 RepID=A0ABS0IEM9_9BACT|nr:helix-turn-helix domain-containing protein [Hymenobacter jeongseonensis]MBF9236770.1 helix-turn-helix domain-containing protein [Hymenobacter jeongseonensis]